MRKIVWVAVVAATALVFDTGASPTSRQASDHADVLATPPGTCTGQLSLVDGSCGCLDGATPSGNQCVCSAGRTYSDGQCKCQGQLTYDASTDTCGCSGGRTTNAYNDDCECSAGRDFVGGECKCKGHLTYNANTDTCGCLDGATPSGNQCVCSASRTYSDGQCKCQGQLTYDASTDTCGCSGGRTTNAYNDDCECTGGREFKDEQCQCVDPLSWDATKGVCACPSGTMLDGDACVPECYWKAGGAGYTCSWDSADKTSLKLKDDCGIDSPASKDNYVADRRINKHDPAHPSRLGAPSNNPKIVMSATKRGSNNNVAVTKATSWLNYISSPSDLENAVTLSSLGVHDLSMTATDYRGEAKCVGCVAVRDDYPPTPETQCQLADVSTTEVKTDFSSTNLQAYIDAEAKFTGFYAASNVKNNADAGDNERVDDKSMTLTDFFGTVVPTTPLTSSCSWSSYVTGLLDRASSMSVEALSMTVRTTTDRSALVCERCCAKSITLKEKYFEYSCENPNPEEKIQGASSCVFNRCLKMQPTALVTASSDIAQAAKDKTTTTLNGLKAGTVGATGPTYVHRSVTCKAWGENCQVQTTLGDLLSKSADWNEDSVGELPGYSADNYVAWVYKVGADGDWTAWNGDHRLSFSGETTDVYVEAWTRCGLVHETKYTVKIHLHSARDVCKDFQLRWADNSPTPRTAPGDNSAVCAYPGSDFALMTFTYDSSENVPHEDGKVKGKYTNIQCSVTVKESGEAAATSVAALDMTSTFGLPATKPDPFTVDKQFAVELVKDPTTAINTAVDISCDFTFRYFDTTTDEDDTCTASFVFTDCDGPTIDPYSTDVVCLADKCGSPTGLPGAYESCDGDVFTTSSGASLSTMTKSMDGTCCTHCNPALQCVVPYADASVKWCQPRTRTSLLALAMDGTQTTMTATATTTVATVLMGASALVAVVALVVVAKSRATKTATNPVDDAYVSLLD